MTIFDPYTEGDDVFRDMLDELGNCAYRREAAHLADQPRGEWLPIQEKIVAEALDFSRTLGLKHLDPRKFYVVPVDPPEALRQGGECHFDGHANCVIYLDANLSPRVLREITHHEADHADAYLSGFAKGRDAAELERRAVAFAHRAMLAWQQYAAKRALASGLYGRRQ